jgi:hypothetical protein
MSAYDPLDHFAIQNTIARYAIALDSKNFDLLEKVFTEDADTVYPFKGPIKGWRNVADAIEKRYEWSVEHYSVCIADTFGRLKPVTSQHALTTQLIDFSSEDGRATATTYFTGIHFGQGKWKGQQVTAWGKYVDELVLVERGKFRNASGTWLIKKRTVEFMGRLGEEGVMEGERSIE